ncbi:MAG: S-layer homology domain-containing protein [Clostridiales bacterium]|nr:S-layer homology domain-containing protein [Clostridiales bacterium]
MKRFLLSCFGFCLLLSAPARADVGDTGFWGGITGGRPLPKTTELLLASDSSGGGSKKKKDPLSTVYKEVIFLDGKPAAFEGSLTLKTSGEPEADKDYGKYTATYTIAPSDSSEENPDAQINREVVFDVNWRREGRQMILDYKQKSWKETITTADGSFTLDPKKSFFNVSVIEDAHPAVTYYRGDISERAVYTGSAGEGGAEEGGAAGQQTFSLETYGSFYGYQSAWSNTETSRVDGTVTAPGWQTQFQTRPSVSVYKTMQYTENEPTAISFDGNFKEVQSVESGLAYDIFVNGSALTEDEKHGIVSVPVNNDFEQLIAPDLTFLKGNYAEDDIKRLFAMQVLDGQPKFYVPSQAITRAQYTAAVVKALKLPLVTKDDGKKSSAKTKTPPITMMFPDVPADDPYFDYIMTSYKAGIAVGRSNGRFYSQNPIELQEALVVLLRSLGLENLGLDPTPSTLFADDAQIADWARRELYAASRIGLIAPDADGKINPRREVTKAEAAALINSLINYMRQELKTDYAEHIVDYTT